MSSLKQLAAALSLALMAGLVLFAGVRPHDGLVRVDAGRYIMGTMFEITAYGAGRASTLATINEAFASIRQTDSIMSHYRPESDLMRLNRSAGSGPVVVPKPLYRILEESELYARVSNGAFDVTVGPVVRLWDRMASQGRMPTPEEIAAALTSGRGRPFRLLPSSNQVEFSHPDVEVTLGAIGKGWAVDRAVEILREGGIRHALVSAGTSTLYALGDAGDGRGWPVELVDPCDPDRNFRRIRLRDRSISTSAAYERYWEIGGETYSHILDPRTGYPVEPLRSVSVIARTATATDALSTAVYVLGLKDGSRLLLSQQAEGFLIDSDDSGACRVHPVMMTKSYRHQGEGSERWQAKP